MSVTNAYSAPKPMIASEISSSLSVGENKFVSVCKFDLKKPMDIMHTPQVKCETRNDQSSENQQSGSKKHSKSQSQDTPNELLRRNSSKKKKGNKQKKVSEEANEQLLFGEKSMKVNNLTYDDRLTEASADDNAVPVPATSTTTLATFSLSDVDGNDDMELVKLILNEMVQKVVETSESASAGCVENKFSECFITRSCSSFLAHENSNVSTTSLHNKDGGESELDAAAHNECFKFRSLKNFMHKELVNLIRGKENLNKLNDSSFVKSKLTSKIARLQNQEEAGFEGKSKHSSLTGESSTWPSLNSSSLSPPPAPPTSTSHKLVATSRRDCHDQTANCSLTLPSQYSYSSSSSSTLKCLNSPALSQNQEPVQSNSQPPPPPPLPPTLLASALRSKSCSKFKGAVSTSSFTYLPAAALRHTISPATLSEKFRETAKLLKEKMTKSGDATAKPIEEKKPSIQSRAASVYSNSDYEKKSDCTKERSSEDLADESNNKIATLPTLFELNKLNAKFNNEKERNLSSQQNLPSTLMKSLSTGDSITTAAETTSTTTITTTTLKTTTTTTKLVRTESTPSFATPVSQQAPQENIDLVKYAATSSSAASSLFSSSATLLLNRFNSLVTAKPFNECQTSNNQMNKLLSSESNQNTGQSFRAQSRSKNKCSSFLKTLSAIESRIPLNSQHNQNENASNDLSLSNSCLQAGKHSLNSRLKSIILAAAAAVHNEPSTNKIAPLASQENSVTLISASPMLASDQQKSPSASKILDNTNNIEPKILLNVSSSNSANSGNRSSSNSSSSTNALKHSMSFNFKCENIIKGILRSQFYFLFCHFIPFIRLLFILMNSSFFI